MRKRVGIIGAGKWGEALSFALSKNSDLDIYITSYHKRDLDNFVSVDKIMQMEYLIFVLSSQHAREWMSKNFIYRGQKILVASKGIELKSGEFLNQLFANFLPEENTAFVSGPSFAKEVLSALPTALVISSKNKTLASEFASFFPDFIKAYVDDDVIGAEVGGAYKNIIAIAGGVCDGLKLGNNARASLISRGLVEMSRFGKFFGAKEETFLSLGGAGDLFLSASSNLSRNYRVGFALAQGKKLDDILKELGEVAEGVLTTKAVLKLANKMDIYTPIAREVGAILDGKDPKRSLKDLLSS